MVSVVTGRYTDGVQAGIAKQHPWSGFDTLVDGLITLQERARESAARAVDEILTTRNWLIGLWIVAFEQEGMTERATARA
jgi:hypothetical protein